MSEKALCRAAASLWASRAGLSPLSCEHPDEQIRDAPAVDLLARDAVGRAVLVLEHTLVESFPQQRSKQLAAAELFQPLEAELSGRLPLDGRYNLVVDPTTVLGYKPRIAEIRAFVADWVMAAAPTLVIHRPCEPRRHFTSTTVPGTNLQVTLFKWPGQSAGVRLVFESPEDGGQQLAATLERALEKKCPKLQIAKVQSGADSSLLLLEIADMALGNLFDLNAALATRTPSSATPLPDSIWLVDTTDAPASVMIAKDSLGRSSDAAERYLPYSLDWQSRPASR